MSRHRMRSVGVTAAVLFVVVAPLTSWAAIGSLTRSPDGGSVEGSARTLALPSEAGAVLSEEQAEVLPHGEMAYELVGGRSVLVRPDEQLPEVVTAEVSAEVARIAGLPAVAEARAEADELAERVSDATGKNVIIVYRSDDEPDGAVRWRHTRAEETDVLASSDIGAVTARLESWIERQPNAETFEVILPR